MWTFLRLLQHVGRQLCTQSPLEIHLQMVQFGYVLGDLVPELKHQDQDILRLMKRRMYRRRLQQIFGSVKFGGRITLKNSVIL